MTGFCHIRIPNYGLVVKSLSEALRVLDLKPLNWMMEYQLAFEAIKKKIGF